MSGLIQRWVKRPWLCWLKILRAVARSIEKRALLAIPLGSRVGKTNRGQGSTALFYAPQVLVTCQKAYHVLRNGATPSVPPTPSNLHVCTCDRRAGLRAQRLEIFQSLWAEKESFRRFSLRNVTDYCSKHVTMVLQPEGCAAGDRTALCHFSTGSRPLLLVESKIVNAQCTAIFFHNLFDPFRDAFGRLYLYLQAKMHLNSRKAIKMSQHLFGKFCHL